MSADVGGVIDLMSVFFNQGSCQFSIEGDVSFQPKELSISIEALSIFDWGRCQFSIVGDVNFQLRELSIFNIGSCQFFNQGNYPFFNQGIFQSRDLQFSARSYLDVCVLSTSNDILLWNSCRIQIIEGLIRLGTSRATNDIDSCCVLKYINYIVQYWSRATTMLVGGVVSFWL